MQSHDDRKKTAALASIAASALLTLGKLAAGLASGSLALLSESGHSLLDTGATIITYFAVRASSEPADDEHHYGHGKIEAVAALAETGLLMVLAAGILIEAIRRLLGHEAGSVDASWPVFAVLAIAITVDLIRWRTLARVARETRSDALAADALHFSSDLVASICVTGGLGASRFGFQQGDTVAAVAVAVFIGIAGWRLGARTIDTLLDRAPDGLAARLRGKVEVVRGVVAVESLKLRPAGSRVVGELGIGVARTLPLERVAAIRDAVAKTLRDEAPETDITITANPVALDDESVLEQVLLIAARRRVPVHHVTVQEIDGVKCVGFDVELDGDMPHGRAHDIASALEDAIRAEIAGGVEVDSHIEPLEVQELAGQDVDAARAAELAAALGALAARGGVLRDTHDVRARVTKQGLVVNYHCRVDPALTVNAVHDAVDFIDHGMRNRFADIARVVGHAEPPDA